MTDARLIGWPIWVSVGLHVAGLATAGTVVSVAHHEAARVLVPVEVVRVEPPRPRPLRPSYACRGRWPSRRRWRRRRRPRTRP